jgi:hypothetical protein
LSAFIVLASLPNFAHADISINARIDNPNPWVREEVLLTVEVVDDRSIIEQKTLPWTPPGVSVRPLSSSEERAQTPDGIRILRRQHWAVMPLYAGELKLQPPSIEARVTGQGRLNLTPEALHLNVRALNPLLPADVPVSVLRLQSAPLPEAIPRGRPFNVNLSIQGTGLSTRGLRHWLDESLRSSDELRIYPPEITLHGNIDANSPTSRPLRQQADVRLTFETTASGHVQPPAIILPYVDPADGTIKHAALPSIEIRSEHPLWLALRPWLAWGMSTIALIFLLIGTWKYAHPRWQDARQRRTWLRALQAADSPKALRCIWQHIPTTPSTQTLTQQLDAACYDSEPISETAFSALKSRLIEHCLTGC